MFRKTYYSLECSAGLFSSLKCSAALKRVGTTALDGLLSSWQSLWGLSKSSKWHILTQFCVDWVLMALFGLLSMKGTERWIFCVFFCCWHYFQAFFWWYWPLKLGRPWMSGCPGWWWLSGYQRVHNSNIGSSRSAWFSHKVIKLQKSHKQI